MSNCRRLRVCVLAQTARRTHGRPKASRQRREDACARQALACADECKAITSCRAVARRSRLRRDAEAELAGRVAHRCGRARRGRHGESEPRSRAMSCDAAASAVRQSVFDPTKRSGRILRPTHRTPVACELEAVDRQRRLAQRERAGQLAPVTRRVHVLRCDGRCIP
jgi:hypothetical protein